jgi:hypothetical protein
MQRGYLAVLLCASGKAHFYGLICKLCRYCDEVRRSPKRQIYGGLALISTRERGAFGRVRLARATSVTTRLHRRPKDRAPSIVCGRSKARTSAVLLGAASDIRSFNGAADTTEAPFKKRAAAIKRGPSRTSCARFATSLVETASIRPLAIYRAVIAELIVKHRQGSMAVSGNQRLDRPTAVSSRWWRGVALAKWSGVICMGDC